MQNCGITLERKTGPDTQPATHDLALITVNTCMRLHTGYRLINHFKKIGNQGGRFPAFNRFINLGPVVQRWVSANPGLKF